MSKLVLSRKAGESVLVGDHTLEVLQVDRANVQLRVPGVRMIRVGLLDGFDLNADVRIEVSSIARGQVKLCFIAPPAVKIIRTELLP